VAFATAAVVIYVATGKRATANFIEATQQETERVVANVVDRSAIRLGSPEQFGNSGPLQPVTLENLSASWVMPFMLERSSVEFVEAVLFRPDGSIAWSTGAGHHGLHDGEADAFATAMMGTTASVLIRDHGSLDEAGAEGRFDAVATFVPIRANPDAAVIGVLEVHRDVTAALAMVAGTTAGTIRAATGCTMAALFVLLVAFVAYLDRRQHRANQRAVKQERSAREEAERHAGEREELLEDARWRLKELTCLHGVIQSIDTAGSLEEALREVVALIPAAWQYPEITRARIRLDAEEYVSMPFTETPWRLASTIAFGEAIRGTLEVFYTQERPEVDRGPFLLTEYRLIGSIALTLSEMIHRNHAEHLVRREAHEREVLAEIGRVIGSSLDIDEVFERFAEEVRRLIPFDWIAINSVDLERGTAALAFTRGEEVMGRTVGEPWPLAGTRTAAVVESRSGLVVTDGLSSQSVSRYPGSDATTIAGVRSVLMVPLISEDSIIGVLAVTSKEPGVYSEQDLPLAGRIAAQIAGAIANARLHAEVHESEAFQRSLLDAVPDFVFVLDADGVIRRVNRVQPGHREEDVIGSKASMFVPPDYHDLFGEAFRQALDTGRPETIETEVDLPDGRHYFLSRLNPVSLVGEEGSVVLVSTDITDRVRAEEERELSARLDAERHELQRVNEAKSAFLSTVSHELRTPLTSIIAFTDIIARNRQGNLTERQAQQLEVVRRNEARLKELIEELLDVSRVDSGRLKLEQAEFDARDMFDEVASTFAPILDERDQTLEMSIPAGALPVWADRSRLAQVASNLVSNASKYSPEHSHIELMAREQEGRLLLSVSDNGIGIAAKDMEKLFTPFFRVNNEFTRSVPGTGLGLVITKAIVEEHGGEMTVDSALGVGTAVSVSIPALLDAMAVA